MVITVTGFPAVDAQNMVITVTDSLALNAQTVVITVMVFPAVIRNNHYSYTVSPGVSAQCNRLQQHLSRLEGLCYIRGTSDYLLLPPADFGVYMDYYGVTCTYPCPSVPSGSCGQHITVNMILGVNWSDEGAYDRG